MKILWSLITALVLSAVSYSYGVYVGRDSAYTAFSEEKCWINTPDNRDVVCIQEVN
jgi:hypothetical protein